MKQVCTRLNALITETDEWRKARLADSLKDLLEETPEIFLNGQEAKPKVKTAIDLYARNPNVMNQLQLLNVLGTIGI
ncbi:MAG TPA: hypothetical protein VGB50_00230 [Flavobacterium sp.]|jgi:hypothetical protein